MDRLVRAFPVLPGKRETWRRPRPSYAASSGPFDTWFKKQVLDLCGVDANKQPEGPLAVTLFDWPMAS